MKYILTILSAIIFSNAITQNHLVKTQYAKTPYGKLGEEDFEISLKNKYITVTDLYYYSKKSYGPVKLSETGYGEDGLFYELFSPDVYETGSVPKPYMFYRFYFDKKGGKICYVEEMKNQGSTVKIIKTYATKEYLDELVIDDNEVNLVLNIISKSNNLEELSSLISNNFTFDKKNEIQEDKTFVYSYTKSSSLQAVITKDFLYNIKSIYILLSPPAVSEISEKLDRYDIYKFEGTNYLYLNKDLCLIIGTVDGAGVIIAEICPK